MAEQRHVVRDPSTGDWRVVAPHAERASAVLETQAEAIDRAREVLRNAGGGELIVHGRTSTLKHAVIAKAGQQIPETFSRGTVKNTDGFTWSVSRQRLLEREVHLSIGTVDIEDFDLDLLIHLEMVVDVAHILVRDLRDMHQPGPSPFDLHERPEIRNPYDGPFHDRPRRNCHLPRPAS